MGRNLSFSCLHRHDAPVNSPPNEASYCEFYVLDSSRQTVAYLTNVTSGTSFTLILSITNQELASDTYIGTASLGNSTLYRFDNLKLIQGQNVERPIYLGHFVRRKAEVELRAR